MALLRESSDWNCRGGARRPLTSRRPRLVQRRPFDGIGFALISPGLALLLYGFERAARHEGFLPLLCGALLLLGFLWHATLKKEKALIDLELFQNKIFATAAITQFLTNGMLYAGQFLIPIYLINGCCLSSTEVGWLLIPMGVGMMCIYPLMGSITDRFGCRAVSMAGALINVIGTVPFLWMTHTAFSIPWIMIGLFLRGFGQGAVGIPTISAAYSSVSREKLGLATTAINIVQRLGGPLATTGVAIAVSVCLNSQATSGDAVGVPGAVSGFASGGALGGLFFVPFLALSVLQIVVVFSASRLPVRISQQS